jgi:hypothetical protein
MQTSDANAPREGEDMSSRHCERSEAIHASTCGAMDCFAALAMTGESTGSPGYDLEDGSHGDVGQRPRLPVLRESWAKENNPASQCAY